MVNETLIQTVEKMLEPMLELHPDDFLVSIKVKPTNNIKVFLDSDEGISIEKCIQYNRKLYKQMEESGLFPEGDFSLEVSSPGVGEPLKLHRQYNKNVGRNVLVIFKDDTQKEGKLLEVTASDVILETATGKGKKAEVTQHIIPFDNIKSTTVQIQF